MRVQRGGFFHHFLTVLVAIMLAVPVMATANDLCPYDVSGDYTYDASRTPTYLFFGDGQITYDGSITWYLDDVMSCYNTYQTPGYGIYFPKCDLDGNGSVSINEVYDIYYRVHPVNQTDLDAQTICSESFNMGPFFYCYSNRYDRAVTDKNAIVANYPAAGAIFDGASNSLGQSTLQWEYNQLRCTTPGAFNPAAFDALNACYLGTSTCAGQPCNEINIDFAQAVDPHMTAAEYSDVAQNFGGVCNKVATGHQVPEEVPGIHFELYAPDNNYWIYDVRATAQCVGGVCACEQRYELYTHKDYPGNVYLMSETNLSTAACTDVRFGGTPVQGDCSGPNVVEDTQSGLCWQDPEHTAALNQADALNFCANLVLDGYDDWHLPTISELRTIIQDCPSQMDGGACGLTDSCLDSTACAGGCSWCATGGDYLDSMLSATDPYQRLWSSSIDPATSNGYTVEFYTAYFRAAATINTKQVRCVRDASGTQCTDTDGDGVCDSSDGCPNDPGKVNPGACGCGTADIDTDGDGVYDCNESCDNDPNKTAPGVCGCGTADIDTDGDGAYNCHETCDNDPNKTAPGVCGCGTPDVDSDGDGTLDCNDPCPMDSTDTCLDPCYPYGDNDGDGVCDNVDGCPTDPNKTAPGQCGCFVADTDSDGDGVANCNDGCATDPNKTSPGICGCFTADIDSDGDGAYNCEESCDYDPNKTAPGVCGCGVGDTDGDGLEDCVDDCPTDPDPDCGVDPCYPYDDTDGDGVCDNVDGCPTDPNKAAAGQCGCFVADTDSDGDGVANCNDGCATDPNKTSPGICGCFTADIDSDGDGAYNCQESCDYDPNKTSPGLCGCGVADIDNDGDGICDGTDNCPTVYNPGQQDTDGDGIGDACESCTGGTPTLNSWDVGGPNTFGEPGDFAELDGLLYFRARVEGYGEELMAYDPVLDDTFLAADIYPGDVGGNPSYMTALDGKLYFRARDINFDSELHVYDPVADQVDKIDVDPVGSSNPKDLYSASDGLLYFNAREANDIELYTYNPTNDQVTRYEIFPGNNQYGSPNQGTPKEFLEYNGVIYMQADSPEGKELHGFNMTSKQIQRLTNIASGYSNGLGLSSYPTELAAFNNEIFFNAAKDAALDQELWIYTPATGGVREIEIDPGQTFFQGGLTAAGSSPSKMIPYNGKLYMRAQQRWVGIELFVYDPSIDDVYLVWDSAPGTYQQCYATCLTFGNDGNTSHLTLLNDVFYFVAPFDNRELWHYDPIADDGGQLMEIFPGVDQWGNLNHADPNGMTVFNDSLFFRGNDPNYDMELFSVSWDCP